MSYLPLPSFFSQLHRHPSLPPPYYPVCNQVCSQPPRAGMLSQPFCCPHAWREVLSPFLIPKAQLPPINSTQPPMMACIRKWPFFFFTCYSSSTDSPRCWPSPSPCPVSPSRPSSIESCNRWPTSHQLHRLLSGLLAVRQTETLQTRRPAISQERNAESQ